MKLGFVIPLVGPAVSSAAGLSAFCRGLEGVMQATGRLHEGIEPFETRFRVEFHDEPNGRTRLEIRQWLLEHLAGPSEQGWLEAFTKLDATLASDQAVAANNRG